MVRLPVSLSKPEMVELSLARRGTPTPTRQRRTRALARRRAARGASRAILRLLAVGRCGGDIVLAATGVGVVPGRRHRASRHWRRSGDVAWAAIRAASMTSAAPLRPRDFKLVRRIGSGDIIGMVYLCHLRSSPASAAERESPCLWWTGGGGEEAEARARGGGEVNPAAARPPLPPHPLPRLQRHASRRYELLYGRTPFANATNEATLRNIVRRPLAFPSGSGSCGPPTPTRATSSPASSPRTLPPASTLATAPPTSTSPSSVHRARPSSWRQRRATAPVAVVQGGADNADAAAATADEAGLPRI
uniref:non-specific serine/threonine protein kinase n=1 Tax=Oryza rufipogon TaxID=4529 RepID=A0A0E0PCY7_ORYRU